MVQVKKKGNVGEREFCKILERALGVDVERNITQTRFGGADILTVQPFAIEVKRQQNLQINTWWKQALRQRTEENPVPVLVWRQNRQPWSVRIGAEFVLKKKMLDGAESWVEISLPHFLEIVKKAGRVV